MQHRNSFLFRIEHSPPCRDVKADSIPMCYRASVGGQLVHLKEPFKHLSKQNLVRFLLQIITKRKLTNGTSNYLISFSIRSEWCPTTASQRSQICSSTTQPGMLLTNSKPLSCHIFFLCLVLRRTCFMNCQWQSKNFFFYMLPFLVQGL